MQRRSYRSTRTGLSGEVSLTVAMNAATSSRATSVKSRGFIASYCRRRKCRFRKCRRRKCRRHRTLLLPPPRSGAAAPSHLFPPKDKKRLSCSKFELSLSTYHQHTTQDHNGPGGVPRPPTLAKHFFSASAVEVSNLGGREGRWHIVQQKRPGPAAERCVVVGGGAVNVFYRTDASIVVDAVAVRELRDSDF